MSYMYFPTQVGKFANISNYQIYTHKNIYSYMYNELEISYINEEIISNVVL